MAQGAKSKGKAKNQLRIQYEYAQEHYGGIATIWKRDFISKNDYQLFNRIYSYRPLQDVPLRFHTAIKYLNAMISSHADLIRKFQDESKNQLTIPML